MAIPSSTTASEAAAAVPELDPRKRCHQCRQMKKIGHIACCKNNSLLRGGRKTKPCSLVYCSNCLNNRYGEKVEEVSNAPDWQCPKCRGVCNCSICMKKKGHLPTGALYQTAKATGFVSVLDLLQKNWSQTCEPKSKGAGEDHVASTEKLPVLTKSLKRKKPDKNEGLQKGNAVNKEAGSSLQEGEVVNKKAGRKRKKPDMNVGLQEGETANKKAASSLQEGEGVNKKAWANKKAGSSLQEGEGVNTKAGTSADGNDNKENRHPGKGRVWSCESLTWLDRDCNDNCSGIGHFHAETNKDCSKKTGKMGLQISAENKVKQDFINFKLKNGHGKKENDCGAMLPKVDADPFPKVIKPTKRITGNKYVTKKRPLPSGNQLTTVAGLELWPDEVGPALQFLEFCTAFGNVLSLTKDQPGLILRELLCGRAVRAAKNSLVAQFHTRLLSLLHKDSRERSQNNAKSWLQDLKGYIIRSQVSLDFSDDSASGYENMESSMKLRLLNFICDEILGTKRIRNFIDEDHAKFVERKKEERGKCLLEKEVSPLSDKEEQPHNQQSDTLPPNNVSMESSNKKKKRSDAVRTQSLSFDENGHVFWKLNGYDNGSHIILQDIKNLDRASSEDNWFFYDDKQEKVIEKHISSRKNWRWRKHREWMRNDYIEE